MYRLNFGRLPYNQDVQTVEFETFEELEKFVFAYCEIETEEIPTKVFLYQYGGIENPIIISCNAYHIYQSFIINMGFKEHNIHEYESYEHAYKTAMDMMEPHELCYK